MGEKFKIGNGWLDRDSLLFHSILLPNRSYGGSESYGFNNYQRGIVEAIRFFDFPKDGDGNFESGELTLNYDTLSESGKSLFPNKPEIKIDLNHLKTYIGEVSAHGIDGSESLLRRLSKIYG